jgi:hypothetical protein
VFLHNAYQIYQLKNVLKIDNDLRLDDNFKYRIMRILIEIHHFDRNRLMEQRVLVGFKGDQRSALPGVLGGNVVGDRPALIQYEAIVILFLFRSLLVRA